MFWNDLYKILLLRLWARRLRLRQFAVAGLCAGNLLVRCNGSPHRCCKPGAFSCLTFASTGAHGGCGASWGIAAAAACSQTWPPLGGQERQGVETQIRRTNPQLLFELWWPWRALGAWNCELWSRPRKSPDLSLKSMSTSWSLWMDDRNVVVSLQTGCSFQKHPNLRRGGHDTTRVERGPDLFQTKKRKFLHKWEAMMANLDGVLASKTGKVILYHCFGRILARGRSIAVIPLPKRSSATLMVCMCQKQCRSLDQLENTCDGFSKSLFPKSVW